MTHVRSDVEVAVTLSHTERQQYDSIRTKARKMIVSAEKTAFAHNLLFYILQMRQVCSHGIQERASRPEPAAARGALPINTVCIKCLDVLPRDITLNSSSAESDEPKYCLECAAEESSNQYLIADLIQSRVCRDIGTPGTRTGIGAAGIPGDDGGGDTDFNATTVSRPEWSSKIDSVVNNLVQLEQRRYSGSTPIKR